MAIKLSLHSLGGAIKAEQPKFNRRISYHPTLSLYVGAHITLGRANFTPGLAARSNFIRRPRSRPSFEIEHISIIPTCECLLLTN